MAAPKIRATDLAKLYQSGDQTKNLQDKQTVESLKTRLNDKILRDPKLAKKAALIIEQWIRKTKP
jgi:hypothetical protein